MKVILPVLSKIGCHSNVSRGIRKRGPDQSSTMKYLPFGEKIVKIGLLDLEIIGLQASFKEERNYGR